MRFQITRKLGHYFDVDEIDFIKDEIIRICPDNASKAYVDQAIEVAKSGNMSRARLNRILGHQLHGSCKKMFDTYPGEAMKELYNRKQYYMKNYGENEYDNKIRNPLDWR